MGMEGKRGRKGGGWESEGILPQIIQHFTSEIGDQWKNYQHNVKNKQNRKQRSS
jgi:hypothetical protein